MNLKRNAFFELTPVNLRILQEIYQLSNTQAEAGIETDQLELDKDSVSEKQKINERKRYATDPIFAEKKRSRIREQYRSDSQYRTKCKESRRINISQMKFTSR